MQSTIDPIPWAKDWSGRLLVRAPDGTVRRLLNIVVRLSADCSLQITLDKLASDRRRLTLSYHPTGLVRFKGEARESRAVFEPLYDITQPNEFVRISVPAIGDLDQYEAALGATDQIIERRMESRLSIAIAVMPIITPIPESPPLLALLPLPAFNLSFGLSAFLPEADGPSVSWVPGLGQIEHLTIAQEDAYCRIRRAFNPKHSILLTGPNGEGEYELTFPGGFARRPPGLINPADPELMLKVMLYSRHRLRFKITDQKHRIVRSKTSFVFGPEGIDKQWWPVEPERYATRP